MNKKIQIIRAIAIFAVICIHTDVDGIIGVIIRPFLNFAVALFLFLSGYLTKCKNNYDRSFFIKRLRKVLIPYFVWSLVYGVLQQFTAAEIFVKILTGEIIYHFYYIIIYIQMVLLTPLISKLLESKCKYLGFIITPIWFLLTRYIFSYFNISISILDTLFPSWIIYYYLGMYLGNNFYKKDVKIKKVYVLYAVSILLGIVEGLIWYKVDNYSMAVSQLKLTSLFTTIIVIFITYYYINSTDYKTTNNKFMVLIGDLSFGIYLSHVLIIKLLNKLIHVTIPFPIISILVLFISLFCVFLGKKILGKYSSYLGL